MRTRRKKDVLQRINLWYKISAGTFDTIQDGLYKISYKRNTEVEEKVENEISFSY